MTIGRDPLILHYPSSTRVTYSPIYFTERKTGILRRSAQLSDAAGSTLEPPARENGPLSRPLPKLPKPQRPKDDKRSDDCGDNVAQRDPHFIEFGEKFEQPEQQPAD